MVKVTFTLDEETIRFLEASAARHALPKSQVVREAIHDYHEKSSRLSEAEKLRMLNFLDRYAQTPSSRTQKEAEQEIAAIRSARRSGGRRHPVD